ncbi:MAG: ATP-binding protein [Burkholderiaceae bacterium]
MNRRLEIIGLSLLAFLICALAIGWTEGLPGLKRVWGVLLGGVVLVSCLGWRLGGYSPVGARKEGPVHEPAVERSHALNNGPDDVLTAIETKEPEEPKEPKEASSARATVDDIVVETSVVPETSAQDSERLINMPKDAQPKAAQPEAAPSKELFHFAQNLHDDVAEHVAAIRSMGLSITQRAQDPAMTQASELIVQSADRIEAAIASVLATHRGDADPQSGLSDAVASLVRLYQQKIALESSDRKIVLRISPQVDSARIEVMNAAYQIVRQALDNAIVHSGATRIEINLRLADRFLSAEVTDNGVGMPSASSAVSAHRGLDAMNSRAAAVGGVVEIGKRRLGGVIVRARLPVAGIA